MAFIKHVGKHGDKKVAIVFRKVPGEDHMALVVYMETIPSNFHDAIINAIESPQGQNQNDPKYPSLLPNAGLLLLYKSHIQGG